MNRLLCRAAYPVEEREKSTETKGEAHARVCQVKGPHWRGACIPREAPL